eukprot:6201238-Pleurochrysis_carterae.AAC.2
MTPTGMFLLQVANYRCTFAKKRCVEVGKGISEGTSYSLLISRSELLAAEKTSIATMASTERVIAAGIFKLKIVFKRMQDFCRVV